MFRIVVIALMPVSAWWKIGGGSPFVCLLRYVVVVVLRWYLAIQNNIKWGTISPNVMYYLV